MKFWHIAHKDLKILARDVPSIVFLFITPILVISIASFALSGLWEKETEIFTVPVIKMDDESLADEFMKRLFEVEALEIKTHLVKKGKRYPITMENLDELVKKYKVAVIIPHDFTDRILQNKSTEIIVLQDPADKMVAVIVSDIVRNIAGRFSTVSISVQATQKAIEVINDELQVKGLGFNPMPALKNSTELAEALVDDPPVKVSIRSIGEETRKITPFEVTVPGYAVMFMLFGAASVAGALLQEKEEGTIRRLISMPASKASILCGKMTFSLIQVLLQAFILFMVGWLAFDMWLGNDLLALVLLILATCVAASGLGMLLATLCRTRSQVNGISILIILGMSALGGSWWPLYIVPEWMQKLAHITITAWAMTGFNTLLIYGGGLSDVIVQIAVLFGMGVLFFGFALKFFRVD